MNRREFLVSVAPAGIALVGLEAPLSATSIDAKSAQRTLASHRITKIEAKRSNDRYSHFVGRGARGNPTRFGFGRDIRTIVTDQGTRGGAMSEASVDEIATLVGQRVSDLFDVATGTAEHAMSIDLPLHDLVGNILGAPVYGLLGAKGPTRVPIYSSAIYFEDLEPWGRAEGIPGLLRKCQVDYDLGYRSFKLKLGRGLKWMPRNQGQERDIAVTRAVRERFSDCKILVDANNGYTEAEFEKYVTAVADCDLYCIEEPFEENLEDYRRLRDHMRKVDCNALIMEGEAGPKEKDKPWKYGWYSRQHLNRLFALAEERLVDVFNMDLATVGFTRWRRVMPELAEAGILASPHTWAGTPRPYYCAHLAAGVGNVAIVEGIPGTATGMDYSAYRFHQGKLVVPNTPGFGITLSL